MTKPSELTTAADTLASVVTRLLPHDADPQLAIDFRVALGNLLAATLGGATVMAAGAVVALDTKVERLAQIRGERLRAVQADVDAIATRVHALEDQFLDDGAVGRIEAATHRLAVEVEQLKERAAGDEQSS